jgi:hypothetical protein
MYPSTLQVVVGDSRWRRRYLILAHLIGSGALLLAAIPAAVQWSGIVGLMLSLYFHIRPVQPLRLSCQQDGSLQVGGGAQHDDAWQTVEVSGSSCISPGCVLLRYVQARERRCRNLLILPDSMPATDFRQFRIWLRWRALAGASAPDQ